MLSHAARRVWVAGALFAATRARAQNATLVGSVSRDSIHTRLSSAEIVIASLGRSTTANSLGEFRVDALPPGRYAVTVRHVGFVPLTDTVEFKAGAQTRRDFVLAPTVQELDSQRVVAQERKYISPGLRGFEERRKSGFGYFLSDSLLRAHDFEKLGSIVRRISGLNLVSFQSNVYAASQRSGSSGAVRAEPADRNSPLGCWVTVYLDGALLYSAAQGRRGASAFDLNSVSVNELSGVEFYHGGATIPTQYNATDSGCGTLLLWTRER